MSQKPGTEDIVERLRERIEKANKMVSALCQGEQRWVMHVPAQRARDPDLVISDGLSAGEEALARIAELEKRTSCTLGVGDGTGRLFVYGDYESIKAIQKIIFLYEALKDSK